MRPTWHRETVGGKAAVDQEFWESLGKRQLVFLQGQGLEPHHFVLDMGCGALRAGVHLIDFLEDGRYYGFDKEILLLQAGVIYEAKDAGVIDREFTLVANDRFDLSIVPEDVRFDYAISHSLFTHLTPKQIMSCLSGVFTRMAPGGAYYSTFHPAPEVDLSTPLDGDQAWRKNERWLTKFPFDTIDGIANVVGLHAQLIGDWGHPDNDKGFQKMVKFSR